MKAFWILFVSYFRTGLFAVGGGLATLPFLRELSVRYPEWFTAPTLGDMVAIAESTPGPIGVNASTFAGFAAAGIPGAVVATLSLVLPSLIVVSVIAHFFEKYRNSRLVNDAFTGLRPAVCGLIAASAWTLLAAAVYDASKGSFLSGIDPLRLALTGVMIALMHMKKLKKIHPIFFILAGAALGLLLPA